MLNLLVSHSYHVRLKRDHGASTSTIRLGDQFNSTSQLISKGRNFTLRFFTIDNTNYSYIGIWYTNDDQARRAWAANPNVPLVTDSAVLIGEAYWSSGIFESRKLLMNLDWIVYHYNLIAVDNAKEKYFAIGDISGPFPAWFLTPEGNILDCDNNMYLSIPEFCYGYQFDNGCAEMGFPTCRRRNDNGYTSPEYAMEGTFSIKSDVFSFGVLVLEIVSGRRNASFYHLDWLFNLIGYVLRTIHVGLLYVQDNATDRPTMSNVVSVLSNERPYQLQNSQHFLLVRLCSSQAHIKDELGFLLLRCCGRDVNSHGAMTMPRAMPLGYYSTSLGRVSWDIALGCAI
ncbi:hypothetical protein LguiA_017731 [Lonicera macranthoides]